MITGDNTTYDWQKHTGEVVVLPIGSTEQHSSHLPLITDCVMAEEYGRIIAEALNAALLPTLNYGTCLEHSGWRGSVSLRPETLMAIVRDIAGEMESQGFGILAIANGHGGNFVLNPVVRDWNRQDRKLKMLLVNAWASISPDNDILESDMKWDFHAGENETSQMMAVRPDLVKEEPRYDLPDNFTGNGLSQADLCHFGIGHIHDKGTVGCPSRATAEKGVRLLEQIKKALPEYIRIRIERLRENRNYYG